MTTLRGIAKECAGSVVASDFSVLAAYALGRTKEFIFREPDYIPTEEESEKLKNVLLRRADKEPVAYIVGEKEFFGLPFLITKDTLVPRPETEHLVEEAITLLSETVPGTVVVDLGTGSGAIAVSVAHATSDKLSREDRIRFFATDISSAALGVAKQNAKRHGADRLITFLEGNLLDPIPEDALTDTRHIVILANLPYLSHGIFESADDDVRVYEPESALVA
ncbi:MAG: peptide chain release factor N(5)-glutamine methyltransferase, partial [Candidatus Moranbacteria bacterium]|nr:peptide chain release factor N(5)-glutamine methyltransferase [Candidatus Moranbacteria bacterium]